MRHAALLLLLCSCTSLTQEQQQSLASHQRNAKYYFEGDHLEAALDQIARGLELDPDNYQLHTLRGTILLRQSGDSQGNDHRLLDQATAELQAVYDTRSPHRHEPYLLLPYALALQKQGRSHLGEALRLRGQAPHDTNPDRVKASADEERETGRQLLTRADSVLDVLIGRGEVLRTAWSHKLQIAQDLGDDVAFVAAANAYLLQAAKDQASVQRDIDRTLVPAYEAERNQQLQTLRAEELQVRGLLAEHQYDHHQFDAALVQLNRVLELAPQRSVDYYNRGRVLMQLNRPADAKADFRKFLATSDLPPTSDKITLATKALDQ